MKSVYTTTEVARLCNLSTMTIIRCFDSGRIKGFRVPGSRFRRIPRDALLAFVRENHIPLPPDDLEADKGADVPAEAERAPESLRALVVEDDVRFADLMCRVLEADDWSVRVATNGFDAGFVAGSFLPQLVILDVLLPKLDGREVCRRLRAEPRLARTKIIAVTALRDEKVRQEMLDAGADDFHTKPVTLRALRRRIQELTGSAVAAP